MSSFTIIDDLTTFLSEMESLGDRVRTIRVHKAVRCQVKMAQRKLGKEFKQSIWGIRIVGTLKIHVNHIELTSFRNTHIMYCLVHRKHGQICPECAIQEVLEN